MSDPKATVTGVAAARVGAGPARGPEYDRLGVFIGKWITEGHTVVAAGAASVKITASDVYEWVPGGFFILHTAYGRIGEVAVGGIEIIGYDPGKKVYRTHFFDSEGNASMQELSFDGDRWLWLGSNVRCRGRFSDQGRRFVALHEPSDDGVTWAPTMEVTITKAG